jgi:hypothetical protein
MMNRMGAGSIEDTWRDMFRIDVDALAVYVDESGGTKTPSWRNERIFDRRRRDDAEGDRRMIGSGRRLDLGL